MDKTMHTISLANWLAACRPDLQIHRLFIPGTHDTMTADCDQRYYKTQALSLQEQLQIGVRFFDLRLRREMVAAHREWISDISAEIIFDTILQFLKCYPQEFILVRLQNANEAKDDFDEYKQALLDKIQQYQSCFYHWQQDQQTFVFPTLAQVAGKVVALECSPPSMQTYLLGEQQWALPWHQNPWISLQDDWDGPILEDKFNAIQHNVAQSCLVKDKLFLNHISATNGELAYPDVYAQELNSRTVQLWQQMLGKPVAGVQIYDFIDQKIAEQVVKLNFLP
ncbi:phospholipase [Gallibacterium salpingitidis]|uniref:phosphatidylinositol-specific phospholipase C domain-containing protein n=1 Tax=Gallibacterium salpingitidis TaxID=505341 RepID=UPI00266FB3B2|nr:phosphatidylinositol-specific phospholipase C domain-containing protein [Gallibacterium salpingitidis]WKT00268.1 phospholipase [Gallibacterium salpingitidis]